LFLTIAKKHNVPVRIAQSHSAQQIGKKLNIKEKIDDNFKKIMRSLIKKSANHYWAVGYKAGEWLFGKKIASNKMHLLPNAKEQDKYMFNIQDRIKYREELCVPKDGFVIGHVGSFTKVKNHEFILEIYQKVFEEYPNSYLCLIGDGLLRESIEK